MRNVQKKEKNNARIRYQRLLIYTFLFILVFMYISAKISLSRADEAGGEAGKESRPGQTLADTEPGEVHDSQSRGDLDPGETHNSQPPAGAGPGEAQSGQVPADSFYLQADDMWSLALTNEHYPVPEGYPAQLVEVDKTGMYFDSRAAGALEQMLEDARNAGLSPVICSAYRTQEQQKALFEEEMKKYTDSGKTETEAWDLTKKVLSVPGSGEHCMGLAVDIYAADYLKLDEGLEDTAEGQWLRENAQEYGFILRYDRGKEKYTGIDYEPWHFRYVGVKAARYLTEKGICLEEFYVEESLYG